MVRSLRVLLLADTHIGFDWPLRPRVERRRRGPDFLARLEEALEPALRGDVDLVVHGGDLFHRPRLPAGLVQCALAPLLGVADRGIPVFIVPGNHERSSMPYPLLLGHRDILVFDGPRTFTRQCAGLRIAVAGFPFARVVDGEAFSQRLAATCWDEPAADVRLLCMHQAVEGATVGAHDYVFRRGGDVVPGRAIPPGFAAVLCGHIHRRQVLDSDLAGRPLAAPVLYPGSVERTAFAERNEEKASLVLSIRGSPAGGVLEHWSVRPLAARPMHVIGVEVGGVTPTVLEGRLRRLLDALDPDAVVRIVPRGSPTAAQARVLSAPNLRALAPDRMNVNLAHAPR